MAFDAGWEPADTYAHVVLNVVRDTPLLADPRLARLALAGLSECAPDAPGALWGGIVLPDSLRFVVGPADDDALDAFAEHVKTRTAALLLGTIQSTADTALDAVVFYNPVWGGVIYRVWEAGYHCARFRTEYRLSQTIYHLRQIPVEAGLVTDGEAWPFVYRMDESPPD